MPILRFIEVSGHPLCHSGNHCEGGRELRPQAGTPADELMILIHH